jgi:hypothetical protein
LREPRATIDDQARAPIELPPEVARRFFEDMRAYHRERNPIKADEIASRQLKAP